MKKTTVKASGNFISVHLLVGVFAVAVMVTASDFLKVWDLHYLWYIFYAGYLAFMAKKIRDGLFYEPIVVLPGYYLGILGTGTLIYAAIRGTTYNFYLTNLVGTGFLCLVLGGALAQNFTITTGLKKRRVKDFVPHGIKNFQIVLLLLAISLTATFALFLSLGTLPILASNVQEARLNLVSGKGYLNIFFIGLKVLSWSILYSSCVTGNSKRLGYSNVLALLILFLLFSTGGRKEPIIFVVEYASIYFLFNRRRFSYGSLVVALMAVLLFLGSIGSFRVGEFDIKGFTHELGLVFVIRPAMLEHITRIYDKSNYHRGLRYLEDVKKVIPGPQKSANVELKEAITGGKSELPEFSGFTPSIVGEAYMNFGPMGIPWVMFIIGALAGAMYKFMSAKPSYLRTLLYFTLVFEFGAATSSGIGNKLESLLYLWFWVFLLALLYEKKFVFRPREYRMERTSETGIHGM